jgi:mannosylglycoprotein endo-beta-mannosidase
MAEAFGRAVTDAYNNQEISGITVASNMPNITHQQYADDTILPGKSTIKEALNLKSIINSYMAASGQKVNKDKSEIYFLNTSKEVENQICKVMGFKKGQFPCKYLGIALEKGANSSKIW